MSVEFLVLFIQSPCGGHKNGNDEIKETHTANRILDSFRSFPA